MLPIQICSFLIKTFPGKVNFKNTENNQKIENSNVYQQMNGQTKYVPTGMNKHVYSGMLCSLGMKY